MSTVFPYIMHMCYKVFWVSYKSLCMCGWPFVLTTCNQETKPWWKWSVQEHCCFTLSGSENSAFLISNVWAFTTAEHPQTGRPSKRLLVFNRSDMKLIIVVVNIILISHHAAEMLFENFCHFKCSSIFDNMDHRLSTAPTTFSGTAVFAAFGYASPNLKCMEICTKWTQEMHDRLRPHAYPAYSINEPLVLQ